jgi:hypothetical protein
MNLFDLLVWITGIKKRADEYHAGDEGKVKEELLKECETEEDKKRLKHCLLFMVV